MASRFEICLEYAGKRILPNNWPRTQLRSIAWFYETKLFPHIRCQCNSTLAMSSFNVEDNSASYHIYFCYAIESPSIADHITHETRLDGSIKLNTPKSLSLSNPYRCPMQSVYDSLNGSNAIRRSRYKIHKTFKLASSKKKPYHGPIPIILATHYDGSNESTRPIPLLSNPVYSDLLKSIQDRAT